MYPTDKFKKPNCDNTIRTADPGKLVIPDEEEILISSIKKIKRKSKNKGYSRAFSGKKPDVVFEDEFQLIKGRRSIK